MRHRVWLRLSLVGLLAPVLGCAGPGPAARPADFPLHAPHEGFAALHWRVDRTPEAAVAEGVVEVFQPERIAGVVLDFEGRDASGRVVSRARASVSARSFTGTEPWPFDVRLRLTGPEERFTLRVAELRWKVMRAGR